MAFSRNSQRLNDIYTQITTKATWLGPDDASPLREATVLLLCTCIMSYHAYAAMPSMSCFNSASLTIWNPFSFVTCESAFTPSRSVCHQPAQAARCCRQASPPSPV